jgi:hypothetical protein
VSTSNSPEIIAASRTLQVARGAVGGAIPAGLIFADNFNAQPDWHSGLEINDLGGLNPFNVRSDPNRLDGADAEQQRDQGHTLPNGWDSARQGPVWAASFGDAGFPENVEILASNADKTRSGTGKSLVVYRQSTGDLGFAWPSDGQLDKKLDQSSDEVFVRFWMRFSDNWTPIDTVTSGLTKLFRIAAIDVGGNPFSAFSDGDASALLLWNFQVSNFGQRNLIAFRADPQETNYGMDTPPPINTPRTYLGSMSLNFEGNIRDLNGDGVEDNAVTLLSLVTGNPVGSDGIVNFADIWGGGVWRKMEFYVKMNSAPGAMDGIAMQWMDDQLILKNVNMPWQGTNSPGGIKWSHVGFGGNANFHAYDDSVQRTEWRAYDDVEIYNGLPEGKV